MDVFQMTTQITALGKRLGTKAALERPLLGVLAEVVTKVAAFAEDRVATLILAAEVDLAALFIVNFNDIVPLCWNSVKSFDECRIPTCKRYLFNTCKSRGRL